MSRVFLILAALVLIVCALAQSDPAAADPDIPISVTIDRLADDAERLHQAQQQTSTVPEVTPVVETFPSWTKAVYQVRFVANRIIPDGRTISETGGTAVAVGPNKLHTAGHNADGIIGGYRPEVMVGGKWIAATFSKVATKDLAVLTVAGVTLDHVPVRVPEYGERVTIYGLKTKSFAQGTYRGDEAIKKGGGQGLVPLEVDQVHVENGDSGGGVFGDDGCLLGTITGCMDVQMVTKMVPIVSDPPAKAVAALSGGITPPPPQWGWQTICIGGTCSRQWVQIR